MELPAPLRYRQDLGNHKPVEFVITVTRYLALPHLTLIFRAFMMDSISRIWLQPESRSMADTSTPVGTRFSSTDLVMNLSSPRISQPPLRSQTASIYWAPVASRCLERCVGIGALRSRAATPSSSSPPHHPGAIASRMDCSSDRHKRRNTLPTPLPTHLIA